MQLLQILTKSRSYAATLAAALLFHVNLIVICSAQPQSTARPGQLTVAAAGDSIDQQAEPRGEELQWFESKIRPVLVEHCYQCHSEEAAEQDKLRGGLFVDSREGLREGGDSGPAVIPGDATASLLLEAMDYESFEMPPEGPLPKHVVADFRHWIEQGATDPRSRKTEPATPQVDLAAARTHWAYQPIDHFVPPAIDRAETAIDAFLQEQLNAQGIAAGPRAARQAMIRRLYFDLIGLPPTRRQVQAFVDDSDPRAYEKLVDRLLMSPHFGERWARHWMDISRYAESITLRGFVLPEAWRYRDYLIELFNEDRSLADAIVQQIAGDLLPADDYQQRQRNLIATTFLTLGNTNLENQDKEQLRMDVVDEQLDSICTAFLAQTVGCARCHDHKFDPIPTTDYYAMAGILRNTKSMKHANVSKWIERPLPLPEAQEQELRAKANRIEELKQAIAAQEKQVTAARKIDNPSDQQQVELKAQEQRLKRLRADLKTVTAAKPHRPMCMSVLEESTIEDTHVHVRGNVHLLGDPVPRGFLQIASSGQPLRIPADESGRLQLAEWIVSVENPLTSRVLANRIWHWLMGRGLVSTVDNFGTTGRLPTHPRLLDYLAVRLRDSNWSTKSLVREIVLSAAYQRMRSARLRSVDPRNVYFAGRSRLRLEAETILDAILRCSGQLELTIGGRTIPTGLKADYGFKQGSRRRAIYWPVFRNSLPDLFLAFDFPNSSMVSGRRSQSSVPTQALFVMNSPWMLQQCQMAARRIGNEPGDRHRRIETAFYRVLSRPPTADERQLAAEFLQQGRDDLQTAWAQLFQSLLATVDFRYVP